MSVREKAVPEKSGDSSNNNNLQTQNGFDDSNNTQYSDKPIEPTETKLVINETRIVQARRGNLEIENLKAALQNAEDRYYDNRSWLYDMYTDIQLDGHLSGVIAKRLDTVLNKMLLFKKNGKTVDEMTKLIKSLEFRNVCRLILEAQLYGTSGIEFKPGLKFAPREIPRKHIKRKWQLITIEQEGSEGFDYTTASNIMVLGEPEDLGLLLKCAAYIIYKRNGMGDWAQYISIFGQPIRVMYYDATDQQAKIELKQTLDDSGSSLTLMIPKGVDFELKDGKASNGDGELQNKFINFCNREISISLLGNTETTTHDGKTGTGGKSKIHKEQQDEISKSDMFYLLSNLNSDQFLQILKSYGYPVDGGEFINTQEIAIEYLAERILIDTGLVKIGVPIDDDYFYDTYGIPKPKNYEQLKKKLEQMSKAIKKQLDPTNTDPADDDPADNEPVNIRRPQQKASKKAKTRFKKLRNWIRKTGIASFFF